MTMTSKKTKDAYKNTEQDIPVPARVIPNRKQKRNRVVSLDDVSLGELVEKQGQRGRVEAAVLATIGTLGLVALAVMAPNAVQLLRYVAPKGRETNQRQSVTRAVKRLEARGLIVRSTEEGGGFSLTGAGEAAIQKLLLTTDVVRRRKRKAPWDRHWRIVIFDVPEAARYKRDLLRELLAGAGFVHVQHSVWVYPYPCDDTIELLRTHLELGTELLYIIARSIENDKKLRLLFKLH